MDIKVYDQKVRDLQGNLTFLENVIKNMEAKSSAAGPLEKLKKLYKIVESTNRLRHPIETVMRVEKTIRDIKARYETKNNDPSHAVPVKKEEKDCDLVSETPDSPTPSPTRHYERTSPIEIPTERSDDRDYKVQKEKDSRYDDNRRHKSDNQRSERSEKYGFSRYDSLDRNRSRYDQHERSKSRDRDRDRYRSDRRERSDSSERGRYVKKDRNRYHRDSRDSRENSWKKYEDKSDRISTFKTERSDGFSPISTRDFGKSSKNFENDSNISAFNRIGARPAATVAKSSDNGFTAVEIAELTARNKRLYGCDDEAANEIKNLTEVRCKLANQMKLSEMKKNREQKPSLSSDLSELNKMSLIAPNSKPGSLLEISSLQESSPSNSKVWEDSNKFSFIKTLNQPNRTNDNISSKSKDIINIDDDIIKKIVTQPMNVNERMVSPVIQDMNIIKQALETARNQERLALKYNPKVKPRIDQSIPETVIQPQQYQPESNSLQLITYNDPRLPPRARDPRVQAQQDSLRLQAFSPPPTPPCIPNYPPILQSSSSYKQNSYPNHFPNQPNAYPRTISPQNHLQQHSNLISITPHTYNNHRPAHHNSPVSSSDMSPPPRFQYQPPSFPDHRQPSGIHNKFRPSLNDNVERQKYEQSRARRPNSYYEKEPTPQTYGEYKRSLQTTVSSTSEKVNNKATASTGNISTSYHDKVYRSGNYSTPVPSVTAHSIGSKFKIPKKTTNESAKVNHATDNFDSKDSEDEQSNPRADDSECETIVSGKTVVNSDTETSENRDPRVRVQALKKATQSSEGKTKDSTEKQNNVVTSSTSIVPENVHTTENLEFLKHFTNPSNLLAFINLVGQISGDSTITKVKEVLEKASTDMAHTSTLNDESTETLSSSADQEKVDVPKTPRKKKKNNELEKLNEDIRTMFISDGVLNATGRRVCALYNNNAAAAKESTTTKIVKSKKQSKDDVAIEKKNPPIENRISRRRNTMVCEPSARSLRTEATKEQSKTTLDIPKSTSTPIAKITQEEIFANISATAKTNISNDEAIDVPTTKRVTRAQLKECNIILEKLSSDASIESVTKADNSKQKSSAGAFVESVTKGESSKKIIKRKRPSSEKLAKKTVAKKVKKSVFKNVNSEFHSLNKHVDCQLCDKPAKLSIVNHYVNVHPNAEVLTCRLAPDVADDLRKRKQVKEAERIFNRGKNFREFSNLCYFCKETKIYSKAMWMSHIATHTGYYQFKCNDCSRKFSQKTKAHMCKGKNNISSIPQPQFEENSLKVFLCDLCNFVRLHQNEMEKHLKCEHEFTELDKYKEIILFVIPDRGRKKVSKTVGSEEEDEDVADDDDVKTNSPKRSKLNKNSDKNVTQETPPEKALRSRRVINTEAFISEPKQDDGLFDKDTMKLMKDMSFSASKDGESATRSNRAKSIAQKLSERFNSVQEGSECKSEEQPQTKAEPLDPMTCDEGIPIIRVTANEDYPAEETNETVIEPERVLITVDKESPSSSLPRENNHTPTEEFNDESDDNWESYSSNDTDEETDVVDESEHTVIQRQPNRKNVGIIDTITRLQQSISSQGTSSVEGVEKLSEITFHDGETVKDEEDTDTISTTSERQIATDSQRKDETTKLVDEETSIEEEKKSTLTYAAIVEEAMELEAEDAGDAKSCVSNGRSTNASHSVNFKVSDQSSQFNFRSAGLGGLSSNADSSNNDVDMLDINAPAKILTRIDNIGYTRSTGTIGDSVTFCCLIDVCGFESTDLSDLLCHIDEHSVEWAGFCYSCNAQINNGPVQLMMEFMHMTQKHYNKSNEHETTGKTNAASKPSFIKCKLLPGDKLSKLKEEEIAAQAGKMSITPKPSTSTFIKIDSKFLKIANVKTVTRTPERKPSEPPMLIAKVVSLGAAGKEYDDSEIVPLKSWERNPTNKLQKNCKKMLRDICLYALYKCMDLNCAFTTDNADNMLTHLRNHENGSSEPRWLECAYCDTVADSCALLVKHIQDEHQSSIFQCPYCFYRSCAAYNVVVHLKQFHASDKMSVLVCNGKPRMYATEKAFIEKSRGENIRPLRCTEGCNKITYVMDNFVKHMRNSSVHNEKFKCQFCGFNTLISETAKHLLVHSVGVYECVYCHFGINDVESIQNHMCNTHPSKLLYICVRLTRKDRIMSDEQLSSVESTMIFHLGQTVDNKLFQRCPFTDHQLSYMNPEITSNASETTLVSSPIPSTSNVSTPPPSIGINIASVASISSDLFSSATETVAAINTGLMLSDVLSYKDLEKDYMADDWDKYFATLPETNKPHQISKRKSSVTQPRVQLPDNKNKASTSTASRTDLMQEEIDNAAYILVKGTGLEGRDLYRCSFADCDEKSSDIFVFNMHLVKHNASATGFKCYHCNVVSKNIVGLKYHIKVHGIHRYFCYYCNYTSAIVNDIQKHMQDTHSRTHVTTIPLNPKKQDQNKDMFVMCPGGLRQDELNRFGMGLIERNKRQLTSTKKFYSPDDIDSLPRQAIFNSSIACGICDYSTKVRTNMYRHLVGHKDEKSVPKVDPVNPVPCLDTGEKHFDKMINLACSSNDGKATSTPYDSSAFVPEGRRFVCNARNCQYQNISEGLLKRHLTTLHPNEENYKCPHCNSPICQKMDADKVIFHLRMHDSKIYKCPKCLFTHHVKSIVEKHTEETHIGVVDAVELITRDETTSSASDGQPKVSKWKCNLCNDLFATQKLIQAHIQTSHSIKYQYQCDICSEVQSNNKTNIQDHINLKHPNMGNRIKVYYTKVECTENDNTPIWRRDDPNKIKHIRGILFEEENVRKSSTTSKKDQSEVKKKTSQKKRPDKPVVEQNSDIGHVPATHQSETKLIEDSESNAVVIISDEDTDVEKATNKEIVKSTDSNPLPSTSKNLLESGKSYVGNSATSIKLSQTVVRAEATSSGIKTKKDTALDKPFLCGRCCEFSGDTIPIVRAHQATAHANMVCEVFMRNTKTNIAQQNKITPKPLPDATVIDSKQTFSESINYVCYHCIFKSQSPTVIYKHWKENHKFPKITTKNIEFPSRPFMFRTIKIFQCCYCRRCSHYRDLKVHCQRVHPRETFAMIDKLNPGKCALCLRVFTGPENNAVSHFKEFHNNLTTDHSTEPDNYFSDELLDQITAVLPREQVRCTQTNCNIVFFSMAELQAHTTEKHSNSQMQFVSIPNDPILYGCINCPETRSSESAMVAHIRDHLLQFQCKFCEKRFIQLEMIKVHHDIMHNSKDETYRNVDVKEHLEKYLAMKIIFPNGFVLTKGAAKRTRYGDIEGNLKLATELNIKDLEMIQKRQEEKDAKPLVSPLVINKKNLKRCRIADSSDSDSDSDGSCSKASLLTLQNKLKAKAEKLLKPSAQVDSSISNSDDNMPLKNLIPFSYYGRKPEQVDLSKIFIYMPFGNATVRVSCDRFALLFNVNPKLRIERCPK